MIFERGRKIEGERQSQRARANKATESKREQGEGSEREWCDGNTGAVMGMLVV